MVEEKTSWSTKGIELPDVVRELVKDRAMSLNGGRTGLEKFVWTVLALHVMSVSEEDLYTISLEIKKYFLKNNDVGVAVTEVADFYRKKRLPKSDLKQHLDEVLTALERAGGLQNKPHSGSLVDNNVEPK